MILRVAAALAVLSLGACASGDRPGGDDAGVTPRATATADGFDWTTEAAMPTPRTEVAAASLSGRVFVAGGFTRDGDASAVVDVYDTASQSWTDGPPLPEPRHHAGMAAAGGRLYLVGGYGSDGAPSAEVWSLAVEDGEPGEWRSEPDLPTARGALAVAAVGDRIHAVGGASSFGGRSQLAAAHEAFDPAAGTWERLPGLPDPRDHLSAAGEGDRLFVAGGRKLSLTSNSSRLDVFDPAAGEWSRGPDMPTARGGLAAAAAGGLVLVFGGEEPEGTFPEAEAYEIGSDRWVSAPDLPTPRHGLGAAVVDDRVYVVGGGPEPGLSVSGANEVLQVGGSGRD